MNNNSKNMKGEYIVLIIVVVILIISLFFFIQNILNTNKELDNNNSISKVINENNNETTKDENKNEKNENSNFSNEIVKNLYQEQEENKIAEYTTTIYDTDANRIDNIKLTCSKLNGAIVKKNEEFSFNNQIGPMNEEQGFKKALGFDSNGNKIQISGGGICQISSTLYNCLLIAGLNVTERHPHSRRVYYVPQDKDATILYGSLDLKFINNTNNDIKIESNTDGANVTVILKEIRTVTKVK